MCRYDNVNGSDVYGNPVLEIPPEVLESITRNGVSFHPPPHFACIQHLGLPCSWSGALPGMHSGKATPSTEKL